MNKQQQDRAEAAKRLLQDPIFAEAMESVRTNALLELAEVDPTDMTAIMRWQAVAHCTQEVLDFLDTEIKKTGAQDGGYSLANRREDGYG